MRRTVVWVSLLAMFCLTVSGDLRITAQDAEPCGKECVCHHHPEITVGSYYPALLCSNCGFGNKKENCVLCGKWVGGHGVPARLCTSCGFGNKKENCVLCGRWVGSHGVPGQLCSNCGFGTRGKNCVKCGKATFSTPSNETVP